MTYEELEEKINDLTTAVERLEKTIRCVQDGNARLMDGTVRYGLYDLKDEKLNMVILEHLADERDVLEQRINTLCNIRDRADEVINAGEGV